MTEKHQVKEKVILSDHTLYVCSCGCICEGESEYLLHEKKANATSQDSLIGKATVL